MFGILTYSQLAITEEVTMFKIWTDSQFFLMMNPCLKFEVIINGGWWWIKNDLFLYDSYLNNMCWGFIMVLLHTQYRKAFA